MNTKQVHSAKDIDELSEQNPLVLAYFKMKGCSVCEVLKPKVYRLLEQNYPMVKTVEIEITSQPSIAAHFSVLSAPTVLVFANKKEAIRKAGVFSIDELSSMLKRIYALIY